MRYTAKWLMFFLLFPTILFAQRVTVSGYVRDADTGESLIGATVYHRPSGSGAATNAYGYFSLALPQGQSTELLVSYVGYQPLTYALSAEADTLLQLQLNADGRMLQEVVVNADKQVEAIEQATQMSAISVPIGQMKQLPALLGEVDVLKVLQLLPGVQSGTEGGNGLYVRGGGPDQNLILLDGVPVYNVSHFFGFFSVFNADAVNRVELFKGGFPARYGGRLSSVVDISLKDGNMQEFHGEGSIGLISSKLTLEGPLKKDKASFLVSARRTYIDLLARPLIRRATDGDETVGYYFYDLNAKLNYKISPKDRLFLSVYNGLDKAYSFYRYESDFNQGARSESEDETFLRWGNTIGAFRWNHLFNPKLFT